MQEEKTEEGGMRHGGTEGRNRGDGDGSEGGSEGGSVHKRKGTHKEFAAPVLMLRPAGPLADRPKAIPDDRS